MKEKDPEQATQPSASRITTSQLIAAIILLVLALTCYVVIFILRLRHNAGFALVLLSGIFCVFAWIFSSKYLGKLVSQGAARGKIRIAKIVKIIAVVMTFLTLPLLPYGCEYWCSYDLSRETRCRENLREIALAMFQYADEHNDKLPDADKWVDEIMPYFEDSKVFKCPVDESKAKCSYAMNAKLSGFEIGKIANPSETALVFDSSQTGNSPRGGAELIPDPPRHLSNNMCYAAGTARWLNEFTRKKLIFDPKQKTAGN